MEFRFSDDIATLKLEMITFKRVNLLLSPYLYDGVVLLLLSFFELLIVA